MRKGLRQAMIVLGICMCLGAVKKKRRQKQSRKERRYRAKTEIFSESYSEETEKVKFECVVNVPEKFEVTNFHAPIIKVFLTLMQKQLTKKYVEGKVVTEEYHDEPTIEMKKEMIRIYWRTEQ